MGRFRKGIIALITIMFSGALMVFTAQANLDLLKSVYPNPQFYMFGLLALEGGIVFWVGYYLLHLNGTHKAIAVISLAIDAILSGVGFFYEMENTTKAVGTVSLPPVIVIVAFAVVFNVGMAIICHLIPSQASDSYVVQSPVPTRVVEAAPSPTPQLVPAATAQTATLPDVDDVKKKSIIS